MEGLITKFVFFWAVIDPIGTLPVFLAITAKATSGHARRIALSAVTIAAIVLLFFILAGELLLNAMGIPLSAFQVAGGIVLFLFALTMIFGESKPEEELHLVERGMDSSVFPLAIPSIAGPGAMMAAVMMTDKHRFSPVDQVVTTLVMLTVLAITLLILLLGSHIQKFIGTAGASVISRVMGLLLAAVAANAVLSGITEFFSLAP